MLNVQAVIDGLNERRRERQRVDMLIASVEDESVRKALEAIMRFYEYRG